jgi:hypothetical protein
MLYLDYMRLNQTDVDPIIRNLLLNVYRPDNIRRVQSAFPEFFTYDKPNAYVKINLVDLARRRHFVEGDEEHGTDEWIDEISKWFCVEIYHHECRTDGEKQKDYEILPADFSVERDDAYDGLTGTDPWIITLSVTGKEEEHLVLRIQLVDDEACKFFLLTIPMKNIGLL